MASTTSTALMVVLGPDRADHPTHDDLLDVIGTLQADNDALRDALEDAKSDYGPCRCERGVVCVSCRREPGDCDCSHVMDDLAAEFDPDDPGTDDPLARVLLGLPSGLHCHCDGRCMSGHCGDADA